MKKLDLVIYGDPELQKASESFDRVDNEVRELSNDMFYTMRRANGVGLACPQIGINRRLFVMAYQDRGQDFQLALINPVIKEFYGDRIPMDEGCLSVPGIAAPVYRPASILVEGIDLHEEPVQIKAEGMLARIIQHEIDHLDGKLFVERLESNDYKDVEQNLKKLRKKTVKKLGIKK